MNVFDEKRIERWPGLAGELARLWVEDGDGWRVLERLASLSPPELLDLRDACEPMPMEVEYELWRLITGEMGRRLAVLVRSGAFAD